MSPNIRWLSELVGGAYRNYAREILPRSRESGPATGAGERIYAIGDVHGRFDLLNDLLQRISADTRTTGNISTRIILLGDLVDKGPCTKQVLQLVRQFDLSREDFIVLCGNHEEMLLKAADGHPAMQKLWLENGGWATLNSFGIDRETVSVLPAVELGNLVTDAIGVGILNWLRKLPLSFQSGDYFFCHAGIRPGVRLSDQRREDLLWIREDFLESETDHGCVVIHGHSEGAQIDAKRNRINIDTAAYRTGFLTALGLEGESRWVLEGSVKK